jgi:AraC-like DNA-binding protein
LNESATQGSAGILVEVPTPPRSSYRELPAPPALRPYVACLWVQTISPDGPTYEQPVLPDGCSDLVVVGEEVKVAGPMTEASTAKLEPGSATVGVRFRTGAAPSLLGVSAAELRDQDVAVGDLWGRAGTRIAGQAAESPDGAARLQRLVDGLVGRLDAAPAVDPLILRFVELLAERPGRPLPGVASALALSERQLRRRAEDAIGYSPRTLSRILRFQQFLTAARSPGDGHRDLARLAAEAGYADQAHLTRETHRLTGLPPAALFAEEAERLGTTD